MRTHRLLAGMLAMPVVALASTLIPHTLAQRAEASDRVVLVQVLSRTVQPAEGATPMKTLTRVVVGRELKGRGPQEFTIVQLGGIYGVENTQLPGDASFEIGETAVAFVRCRLAADRCHLVGLGEGKLELKGEKVYAHDLINGGWRVLTLDQLSREIATPSRTVPENPTKSGVKR